MLFEPQNLLALVTLTSLEIVLGIDNIIIISILSGKLPVDQQDRARVVGLGLAMFMRVGLLLSLTWMMSLTNPLFSIASKGFTGRDLILILGGLFLIAKSTHEIHERLEGEEDDDPSVSKKRKARFWGVIVQILLMDIVFSLDSVITAVGMANRLWIMIAAVVIAVLIMMFFSGMISRFVNHHPTVKILALSFLLMIGIALIADGLGQHFSKGYIYFAMAFSVFVESLNLKMRKKSEPIKLRDPYDDPT